MRILVIGFGVVGRSFTELLATHQGDLYRDHGLAPRLVGVVDSGGAAVSERGLDLRALLETKANQGTVAATGGHGVTNLDTQSLIADSDADVVIEATPSRMDAPETAMGHIRAAFRNGKHVITVNKAPLALAMPPLTELARYNRVQFRFSGTVGGGTPMLNWARECARGDQVVRLRGILNGTTNFILSKMHETGARFDEVLDEAVRLGYAETDPSADIDGVDAATKVVILANLILNRRVTLKDVQIEGIRGLSTARVKQAADKGESLKLIAEIGDTLSVSPQTVPRGDPLDVPANLNALTMTLRNSGDVTLVGRGAGGVETATAVLRDLLDIWSFVASPDGVDKPFM